ncbi:MAG TPA: dihydrodipicolinate synthase family protein [Terriglobia bacterium]|nr:dihydrodipicolinate synthase family protein [Terriglobia bacterium]
MISWLRGVIPAVITPFDQQGKIDEKALRAEVEYHIASGVSALCAGGTTGEGAGLSPADVKQLNQIFVDQARGRVPVIGGVIPDTTIEAVEVGLAAKEAGASLLQVTPPHYIFQPEIPEMVAYYSQIREKTGLDIILYNVLPWGQVSPEGVEALIEAGAIVAVKQSGANLHQLADMVYRFGKQIPVLSAVDDLLYPAFVLGAQGTLSAICSVLPRQSVELYQAVQKGDHARALELHNQLLVVWRAVDHPSAFFGRVKCAIEIQGRRAGWPRHPHRPAREDERSLILKAFEEAGIPLAAAATT